MYEVKINWTSRDHVSAVDRLIFSKPGNAEAIEAGMIMHIIDCAEVHVTNDKSESKEYDVLVMKCLEGVFQTSSEAMITGLKEAYDTLHDAQADDELPEGDWYIPAVKVGKRRSKTNSTREYFYPIVGGASRASEVL